MILKNLTKKTIVTTDLKEAKSIIDIMFGLLKKSNPRSLLFKTRFGIHTFCLKEAIDVLVLDKNNRVVKLSTINPNSLFFWNIKYSTLIELPIKTIKKSKIQIGDLIGY